LPAGATGTGRPPKRLRRGALCPNCAQPRGLLDDAVSGCWGRRRLCSCESFPALDERRLGGESTRSG
jgi:hypothetical protein